MKRILKAFVRVFGMACLTATVLAVSLSRPAPSNGNPQTGESVRADQCPDGYPIDCGDRYCCKSGQSCCGGGACCPSDKPHYCPRSAMCYQYYNDAQKDCGNDYTVCGRPR
jgi:hypothetical protein